MGRGLCQVVDGRGCRPFRGGGYAVSLHNHSVHSIENLASLNEVVKLFYMRPLSDVLRRAFGLEPGVDYRDLIYNPPYTPEQVYRNEAESAAALGFEDLCLAITDHDECAGSVALFDRSELAGKVAIGEEVSIRFDDHVFHLGVSGLPREGIAETHRDIQRAARSGALNDLFEILSASGCLVVFNHPLIPWGPGGAGRIPAHELLARYGWAIHALEYNGMREQKENDGVLALAEKWRKPVVGGGDSHLLAPSSALCAAEAKTYAGFVEEVKDGLAVTVLTPHYFAPLRWKLFLRVLYFIANYRKIATYRGERVAEKLVRRRVLLDPAGRVSRAFLAVVSNFGLLR